MQNIELIFIYAIVPISLSQSKLNAPYKKVIADINVAIIKTRANILKK